jgi:hypothetical protein
VKSNCEHCHYCGFDRICKIKNINIDDVDYDDCWFFIPEEYFTLELEEADEEERECLLQEIKLRTDSKRTY